MDGGDYISFTAPDTCWAGGESGLSTWCLSGSQPEGGVWEPFPGVSRRQRAQLSTLGAALLLLCVCGPGFPPGTQQRGLGQMPCLLFIARESNPACLLSQTLTRERNSVLGHFICILGLEKLFSLSSISPCFSIEIFLEQLSPMLIFFSFFTLSSCSFWAVTWQLEQSYPVICARGKNLKCPKACL